jgi:hypothetical protein
VEARSWQRLVLAAVDLLVVAVVAVLGAVALGIL